MTGNECVVCGRPTPDGYACTTETERARQQLAEIAELTEPARAVMCRQTSTTGTVHSTPGPRDLLDYGAGQRLMNVQIALTGWARAVAEERGVGATADSRDLIVVAAQYLADDRNLEWLRHVPWVDEVLREVGDCAATMRGIVATPAGRVYLGTCGAERAHAALCFDSAEYGHDVECECWCHDDEPDACDGDVYGKPDKAAAYCNTCGAAYDQAERRVQVAALVQGVPMRASVIAHAHGISVDTIRGWAWVKRDKDGNPLNEPKLKPAGRDDRGRPLYLVADVLALEGQAEQRRRQRAAQAAGMGA